MENLDINNDNITEQINIDVVPYAELSVLINHSPALRLFLFLLPTTSREVEFMMSNKIVYCRNDFAYITGIDKERILLAERFLNERNLMATCKASSGETLYKINIGVYMWAVSKIKLCKRPIEVHRVSLALRNLTNEQLQWLNNLETINNYSKALDRANGAK